MGWGIYRSDLDARPDRDWHAIAQEQIWFDGGVDNNPPVDCPLPRIEVEVDTDAYRASLSVECGEQNDRYPRAHYTLAAKSI